jgi:hypothetical protein
MVAVAVAVAAWVVAGAANAEAVRPGAVPPATWLRSQPPPEFREGHTLPPLTRYGWALDGDSRIEFADRWGYCLELAAVTPDLIKRVRGSRDDVEAKMVALAARDPDRFKLQVIVSRQLPDFAKVPPETWTRTAAGMLLNGQAKSLDGMAWTPGMQPVFSPLTPDSVWQESGRLQAEPLRQLREMCPIAVILNGGEYGMPVPGWAQKVWEQDPAIVKAKGRKSWADFGSERLAHSQRLVADAIKQAVPDRTLYVYYHFGGVPYRNSYGEWKDWQPVFADTKGICDLPNSVAYYKEYNTGWTWEGDRGDLLTQMLTARGEEIAAGYPLAYNWLCGGYKPAEPGMVSEIKLYAGFLKMLYTAGMVGGNAGYYDFPVTNGVRGFDAPFPPDEPPPWIQQMVVLARVHAQFSFLEHYLREGDLLPGPNKHRWSKDQPAYEFPTGDANARVVARRLREKPQWLITAWAADGKERTVEVTIPDLGRVKLLARGCATVYKAKFKDGKPVVASFDTGDAYWENGTEQLLAPPP